MRFIIDREKFIDILTAYTFILRENPIRPIIAGLKIEAKENNIVFSGTSLESTLIKKITGEVKEEGVVVIKPALVLEYIKLLDIISIEISSDEGSLFVHKGEFVTLDASGFPKVEKEEFVEITTMKGDIFASALDKCRFCSYPTTDNLALNSIRVLFNKDDMEFVASDSYRLVHYKEEHSSKMEVAYSLPLDSVNSFIKLLKDKNEEMAIGYSQKHLVFVWGDSYYSTRTIDMPFPNFKQILSFDSFDKNMEFNTDDLKSSLKKVITVAKTSYEAKYGAIFDFKNNILTLQSHSGKGKINQKVNMIKNGENFKGSLNTKFLLEFLNNIHKNTVIYGVNSSSMFKIKEDSNENYTYILMPLALRG